jgi:hypothetical protein
MNFSLAYILYWLTFFTCSSSHNMINKDTIFKTWNKATLQSLSKQGESTKDSVEMSLYENRILAFKAFVDINSAEDVNVNSIRYQFVQTIGEDNNQKDFYIIEANRSGERVEIRNYIVYPKAANKAEVNVYNFIDRKWVKSSISKEINFPLTDSLASYRTKFGLGFNQDDVIITRVKDNTVTASEYYLYTTLTDIDNIKKGILSLR